MPSLHSLCALCGKDRGWVRPTLLSVLPIPICSDCLSGERFRVNEQRLGLTSPLPTFSVEFEIHTHSSAARDRALKLLRYHYIRTDDASVSDEYKSPIYTSLSAFRSHLPLLDELHSLVDDHCGTHVHIGFPSHLAPDLLEFSQIVFGPLQRHLESNPSETEQFWGRSFCRFARPELQALYPWVRFSTPYPTLEYRLPRFRTGWQYLEVVRFCRRITYYLECTLLALDEGRNPLWQTPVDMGEQLLSFYHEALENARRQLQRHAPDILPSLPAAS